MDSRRILLSPVIILLYTTLMVITAQGADSNNLTQFCQCRDRQDRWARCGCYDYDVTVTSCCDNQVFAGEHLPCCDGRAYNPSRDTCCSGKITPYISEQVSDCCGLVAYNPLNHLCCNSRLYPLEPEITCCGAEAINTTEQLCCGSFANITAKKSNDDLCCGDVSYNPSTHCCNRATLKIQANGSCPEINKKTSDNKRNNATVSSCPEPSRENICGSKTYNPYTHICCESELLKRNVETRFLLAGMLCCNGKLHRNVTEGSRCHGVSVYDSSKVTVCESTTHPQPHGQCCGRELFDPRTEMCCKGHRRSRSGELECCGAHVYNASDPNQKCCSGQIYKTENSTVQCCGMLLVEDPTTQQCCSSPQLQLVYTKQPGFSCCGHQFYNTSLYSCCEENLQRRQHHSLSSAAGDIGRCSVHPDVGSVSDGE
ncbi:uncharacterized protein [Paramormyrops kingsleyae]|uniref:uncharacterized protein isoform X2 n=1 Tax=Paramormyrops kingsleyae TaxID=1676925 RepID=UPI003B97A7E4